MTLAHAITRGALGVALVGVSVLVVQSGLRMREFAPDAPRALVPLDSDGKAPTAAQLRARVGRDPIDFLSLLALAQAFEREGRRDDAVAAAREAIALAPADRAVLVPAAELLARSGSEAEALAVLRRLADLYPETGRALWPAFVAALDTPTYRSFFDDIARADPRWWPEFFEFACAHATLAPVRAAYLARAQAGLASAAEQRCVIARLQREKDWDGAYRTWRAALQEADRPRVPAIFNGDFERPLSNLGFDWIVQGQAGVAVDVAPVAGATGRNALRVRFADKRWASWPLYQYAVLAPGRYRLEGRARADGLDTWLGLQWALYCADASGRDVRQLVHTDAFAGRADWKRFGAEFAVARDCPLQVLRLELANPDPSARTGGSGAVRLNGTLWFDDLRVAALD